MGDGGVFIKEYADPIRLRRTLINHAWLAGLGAPSPRVLDSSDHQILFQQVEGCHVTPGDVVAVARLLGRLHAAAWTSVLHDARLDHSFSVTNGPRLTEFVRPRIETIQRRLASGAVPDPWLKVGEVVELIEAASGQPAAFYKDANVRNFLIGKDGPVLVDFDDLTLAPFGYDLAKLLFTTGMTYGILPQGLIGRALAAYNKAVLTSPCTLRSLIHWIEVHHILTSPYLGRNGYRYGWHTLRPW